MIVVNARFLTQKVTGVQRFAIELCKCLPDKINGHDVVFISPKKAEKNPFFKKFNTKSIGKLEGYSWEQLELPIFLKRNKNPLLINIVGIGPVKYKNKILFVHDLAFKHHSEWFSLVFQKTYNMLLPLSIKNSRLIFTVSNYVKDDIVKTYKVLRNKIKVIHAAPSTIFRKLDIKKEQEILMVSSIDPRKNMKRAISAFINIETSYKLIIVGGQGSAFAGVKLNNTNSNVIITGYLSDEELVRYYNRASLFFYPSLFEGFGIPPMEAQICGTPCLVSKTTSLPEVYGESVEYCDPYNQRDIEEKIRLLITRPKRRNELIVLGEGNVKKYSWQDSAEKATLIITKLLNEESINP